MTAVSIIILLLLVSGLSLLSSRSAGVWDMGQ